ncbi:MAG: hypothetical protein WAN61_00975 [Minisyncoccia bacterium]
MNKDEEKEITNQELLDAMNRGFSRIEEKMATKEELAGVKIELKSDISSLKTDVAQIKTDLQSFKTETRENFEKLSKDIKENEESIGMVVADYHPHIVALEEKVFGHSTLAEV